ncbi:MAG: hypothetical protein NC231_08035 [Bacillus sp. (in: Bacteria)]|nr:hypothetical protein [Bacillus sp. (in: firmicutes)]MCM1427871.1 hypothetical protein [Eubacterium sp.]
MEIEEQRNGRNKATIINHDYINSGKYKRKFDLISNNKELSRILYRLAKEMLKHRSGTMYEDMYWIDLDTLHVVAKETNTLVPKRVIYSIATEKVIEKYDNLLTIHTHPDSFPPSIGDFNSNFDHEYEIGIVVCHDGKVYMYSADERVNEDYYKLLVESYMKKGYNESEAQISALYDLQRNFDIKFKEVSDNGII